MQTSKKLTILSFPFLALGLALALPKQNLQAAFAAPISKDTYQLRGNTATLTWGVWDYGAGIAGFANGSVAEGSDTLKSFTVPTEGDYKAVFHYYAGSYPDATGEKRLLNFIVNGRQNIRALTKDPDGNWGVAYSEEFTLHLDAGTNSIMLQGEHGPDSCVNADNLQIFDDTDALIVQLEAEEGTFNNTGIPAPGIVAGFENRNRPSADITINAPKAGLYTLGLNYAGGPDNTAPEIRSLNIGVNAEGRANAYTKIDFQATGDWGVYNVQEFNVELKQGANVITIQAYSGTDRYQSSLNLSDLYVALSGYQQALDFANEYLFMDTVPTTDHSSTANCAANYAAAVDAFNNLYDEGRLYFLTSADFQDARDRFSAWATANGQTFDPAAGTLSSNKYQVISTQQSVIVVVIVSIVATIASLFTFVLIKKRIDNKNLK